MVEIAICNGTLLDVRPNRAKFVWTVFHKGNKATYEGICESLEEAKAAAEKAAGCKPTEWVPQPR